MEFEEAKPQTFSYVLEEAKSKLDESKDEEGRISVTKIRLKLGVGRNRAYDLKQLLEELEPTV